MHHGTGTSPSGSHAQEATPRHRKPVTPNQRAIAYCIGTTCCGGTPLSPALQNGRGASDANSSAHACASIWRCALEAAHIWRPHLLEIDKNTNVCEIQVAFLIITKREATCTSQTPTGLLFESESCLERWSASRPPWPWRTWLRAHRPFCCAHLGLTFPASGACVPQPGSNMGSTCAVA